MNPRLNRLVAILLRLASSSGAVRCYYYLKPALPRALRYSLRHRLARRQLKASASIWPILRIASKRPAGWPGWPDDRRFAVILTHDVESPRGLTRVKQLATIEMSLGFRSSFNFVPEGSYSVPPELRHWLTERGFEVGVHDHRHDGKLYHSFARFSASARRINHFLSEWHSVGFRSAFMLHNLDWIRQLEVLYDSSTFDTDPFEPQSDAAETIFPFLIARPNAYPMVELPYTLPQDSTLFLLLRERTNDIWKHKLAWIAGHGGMALLNVHPDYICFGQSPTRYEYSLELYREFLKHITTEYTGGYWHALPREVAAFFRQTPPDLPCQLASRAPLIARLF